MKQQRVLFVVNRTQRDGPPRAALDALLPGIDITFAENLVDPAAFDLVVLWFYQKILRDVEVHSNVVVFHASALPYGRGMAPIYYTFADDLATCTLSAIRAADGLDCGGILGQAHIPIEPAMTAPVLRALIVTTALQMTAELLTRNLSMTQEQTGSPTYRRRRTPNENEIALSARVEDVMQHLRGCEPDHPAFVTYRGVKFVLTATPAEPPPDPTVTFEWIASRQ
jgi:methionyl-tRNA formyltransferase